MDEPTSVPGQDEYCVIAVFDPDGDGGDFAYTVGLEARFGFELHAWARPTDGLDPGLDFQLSARDLHTVLTQAVTMVAVGELSVGGRWEVAMDQGLAQAVFQLAPVRDRDELECFQARAGCPVASLRWELRRAAVGEAAVPDGRGRTVIERRCRQWLDAGWVDSARVAAISQLEVSLEGEFGPATKAVLAMSASVGSVPEATWELGTAGAMAAVQVSGLWAHCLAVARAAGRTEWVLAGAELAEADARRLVGALGEPVEDDLAQALETVLHQVLGCAYASMVLCDVLEEEQVDQGGGIVEAACDRDRADARFWSQDPALVRLRDRVGEEGTGTVLALADKVRSGGEELAAALDWARSQLAVSGLGCPLTAPWVFGDVAAPDDVVGAACTGLDCVGAAAALAGVGDPRVALLAGISPGA